MFEDEEIVLEDTLGDDVVVDEVVDEEITDDIDNSDSVDVSEITVIEVTRAIELDSLKFEPLDSSFAYSDGLAIFNGTYTFTYGSKVTTAFGQISVNIKGTEDVDVKSDLEYNGLEIGLSQAFLSKIRQLETQTSANSTQIAQNSANIGSNLAKIQNLEEVVDNMYNKSEIGNLIKDFITKAVNDLDNYYTKTEINSKIAGISQIKIVILNSLPQTGETNTIYFIKKQTTTTGDFYDEYMYINNKWEIIGSTQIDLSNYYNKTEIDNLLNGKQATITDLDAIRSGANKGSTSVQPNNLKTFTYWVSSDGYVQKTDNSKLILSGGMVAGNYNPLTGLDVDWGEFVRGSALAPIINAHNELVDEVGKKSEFSGDYNDLTNKPNLSNFATKDELSELSENIVKTNQENNFTVTPKINGVDIATTNDLPVSDITSTQVEITEVD